MLYTIYSIYSYIYIHIYIYASSPIIQSKIILGASVKVLVDILVL